MWLVDLNYSFQCDWLIELSDSKLSNTKLSDNNLARGISEKLEFIKPVTNKEILIFMIIFVIVTRQRTTTRTKSHLGQNGKWFSHIFKLSKSKKKAQGSLNLFQSQRFFVETILLYLRQFPHHTIDQWERKNFYTHLSNYTNFIYMHWFYELSTDGLINWFMISVEIYSAYRWSCCRLETIYHHCSCYLLLGTN